jgi:hypothetical protein
MGRGIVITDDEPIGDPRTRLVARLQDQLRMLIEHGRLSQLGDRLAPPASAEGDPTLEQRVAWLEHELQYTQQRLFQLHQDLEQFARTAAALLTESAQDQPKS